MARDRFIPKREVLPDIKYNDVLVSKFINVMMLKGKRSVSQHIMYVALDKLEEKTETPALKAFEKAIDNVRPLVEVKSRRVGGATYQVPIEVDEVRGKALALRWIISNARKRSEKTMALKLASEIQAAYKEEGAAFKKKEDIHRMAEANKAFSHFRF